MSDLTDLDKSIKAKLASQEEQAHQHYNHQAERMHEWQARHQRFTALADHLVKDIILPRLENLARHFDNAELLCGDRTGRHQCVCSFRHTNRFPATAKLELAVTRDGSAENIWLLYDLSILPVFFQFEGQDRLTIPVDGVNEAKVAAWFDEKILCFLDDYLRLQTVDQYQTVNEVTDPVCGMRINKLYAAAEIQWQGQTYYFCLPECKDKFAADPERHLGAVARG